MSAGRRAILATLMALLLALPLAGARDREGPAISQRRLSLRLFEAALDARLQLDGGSEQGLLLASLNADPASPASWAALRRWMYARPPSLEHGLRRLYDSRPESRSCFAVIEYSRLLLLRAPAGPWVRCTIVHDLGYWPAIIASAQLDSVLSMAAESRSPEIIEGLYSMAAADASARPRILAALAELAFNGPSYPRMTAGMTRALVLHQSGRHGEASSIEAGLHEQALRGPAGLIEAWARSASMHGSMSASDSTTGRHYDDAGRQAFDILTRLEPLLPPEQRYTEAHARMMGLMRLGRLREALTRANGLLSLADSLGGGHLRARVLARRGQILVKMGDRERAERDLVAASEFRSAVAEDHAVEAHHNLLHLYETQPGRDAQAIRAGEAWLALLMPGGATEMRAVSHRDLGFFFQRRQRYPEARRHFNAMLADLDSLGAGFFWAGEYHELAGDLERARDAYRRATLEPSGHLRALAALVRVSEALGEDSTAEHHARLHDAREEHGFPEAAPLLPGVLKRQGRLIEAAELLTRAIETAATRGQTAVVGTLLYELAQVRLLTGDPAGARQAAVGALRAARSTGQQELAIRVSAIDALARSRAGKEAARVSARDLARLARQARRPGWPQLRADVNLALAEAWDAAQEPGRALASLKMAAADVDDVAGAMASDLSQAGYRAAQHRISNYALAIALRHGDSAALATWVRWSVWRKARGLAENGVPAPGVAQLRATVPRGTALVDYVVLDSAVAALVVTDDRATLHRLPATTSKLLADVRALTGALAPRIGRYLDAGHSRLDSTIARRLYQNLVAPLVPVLEGHSALVIVADGPLHALPFDLLLDSSVPLIERYAIEFAPSLASFGREEPAASASVLVVRAPDYDVPIPGAAGEVAAVAAQFPSATVISGGSATEAAVRQGAPGRQIVHLVAHARASVDPRASRIQLAESSGHDGVLHVDEIEQLSLHGSLVILSGCETAAGRLMGGEGTLSLSRAFLRAGAAASIATLWPVGEPTAHLMAGFYRELAAGAGYRTALRAAKRAMVRTHPPSVWAPFILMRRRNQADVTFSGPAR